MPVPDAMKERVMNDLELLDYFTRLKEVGRIPKEYRSYDADTNKPIFDVYKYYDVNSRVARKEPDIIGDHIKIMQRSGETLENVPIVMTDELRERVPNDEELNKYIQLIAQLKEIPPECRNYDKNNKPVFDVNTYYDLMAYQDLQEPETELDPIEYILKEHENKNSISMPIPPELSGRIKNDEELYDEFLKWKKYKSFKNNKPYFDAYKYYYIKDRIITLEKVYPRVTSRLKSMGEVLDDYGKEKKYKKVSSVLNEDELKKLRDEGDKKWMEYLRKIYERNEAIKKGADPWSIPIPIAPESLEYTHEEIIDVPEKIPVPRVEGITKKDHNIDAAAKEYLEKMEYDRQKSLGNLTKDAK